MIFSKASGGLNLRLLKSSVSHATLCRKSRAAAECIAIYQHYSGTTFLASLSCRIGRVGAKRLLIRERITRRLAPCDQCCIKLLNQTLTCWIAYEVSHLKRNLHIIVKTPAAVSLDCVGMRVCTNSTVGRDVSLLSISWALLIHQEDYFRCVRIALTAYDTRKITATAMGGNGNPSQSAKRRVNID